MSESHTRREVESIRQQMNHVRGRLPYAMDIARAEAKQYLSWKYYVGRFPLSTAALTAAVAYWAIPARRRPQPSRRGRHHESEPETAEVAAKASWIGTVTSLLTSLAVRGATSYFSGHLQDYLSQHAAARKAAKQGTSQRERSAM